MTAPAAVNARAATPQAVGHRAARCLQLEVSTWPKPGLVSQVDRGAHDDMDFALLHRSAEVLEPFFIDLARAGAAGAGMERLRQIGIAAERDMLEATGGVNTHRGAIFGLGLLCAAAGARQAGGEPRVLGAIVAGRWGAAILDGRVDPGSHGGQAAQRHGAGGARVEAASGFPTLYGCGLPALRRARAASPSNAEAARVQTCMALIAQVEDTNLLHRGGTAGLAFAQAQAQGFLDAGGVSAPGWTARAEAIHHAFVARRLSPGGCADLLAMSLFADSLGDLPTPAGD